MQISINTVESTDSECLIKCVPVGLLLPPSKFYSTNQGHSIEASGPGTTPDNLLITLEKVPANKSLVYTL